MNAALYQNLKSPVELFYQWEKSKANEVFLRQPYGENWTTLTYQEAGVIIRKMVAALKDMGLEKGAHVGILSKNCYHWILADLAIMIGGYVSVPYYPSLPANQLKTVIAKSNLSAIFLGKVEHWDQKKTFAIPEEVAIIKFPHYPGNAKIEVGKDWDEIMDTYQPDPTTETPAIDDLWTIIFTSGTTGTPKGVMHSFNSLAMSHNTEDLTNYIGFNILKGGRFFSYLPLNHIGERMAVEMSVLQTGGSISFAESLDTFMDNLRDTQPNLFFGVPRIWSKFQLGVLKKMSQKRLDFLLKIPIVSGIIKRKIRTGLGLNDVQVALTGAALTPEHVKEWYRSLGINLREVYGMTEACGSVTMTPIGGSSAKNVGKAIPFTEIKIDAETGEVLFKSPQVMLGYYNQPDKTAEVLKDGWLYSGDKGIVDDEGYLIITGRVKDSFKTSKGKYINPNNIESKLSAVDWVEQVCVAGLGIPQPIALVNLSEVGQQADRGAIENRLEEALHTINSPLPKYQQVSTIVINKTAWSDQNNFLTPTLKIRRGKIDEHYGARYLEWHQRPGAIIWEA